LLIGGRFDVAICHSAWSQAIFGKVVQASSTPLVFWLHDAANGQHWLGKLARRSPPDLVLCNSSFTAGTVPRLYSGMKSAMLHYPIATPPCNYSEAERNAARDEFATPRDAIVIIQVSRLEPLKGHAFHLEANRRSPSLCWSAFRCASSLSSG
jgi:glycosyltransferase involved in cell wall biosynthesis